METERLKQKARIFLKENIKSFLKDIYDNYYFCEIKEINEEWLIVKNFRGKRNGETTRILWIDIVSIQEYREEFE